MNIHHLSNDDEMMRLVGVSKSFSLQTQGAVSLPVLRDVEFSLCKHECLVLGGPSGIGKSTILRMAYGNYVCAEGEILVRHQGVWVDVASASPREVITLRQHSIGYVSQFLSVIPRVSTLDIVSEPLRDQGMDHELASERAKEMLERLNIPERLWSLSPVTFSGGEQQRVNIARGFIKDYPVFLLDEPTASLDAENRATVIELIREAAGRGSAIVGIFHDPETRQQVATRTLDVAAFTAAA